MKTDKPTNAIDKPLTCGLVMPISSLDGCTSEHWAEVKNIITEAIKDISEPCINVNLVSDADDVGVIQKRIVQNIYNSDIIVCDVSGKNPNVMFELGMRLAFDKPTVIVKDDMTDYSFDTGIIEHVPYPRDLRFSRIVTFKKNLAAKVLATLKAAASDPEHSTFLKNFGKFQVANLNESVVTADTLVLERLSELQAEVSLLRRSTPRTTLLRERSKIEAFEVIRQEIKKFQFEHPSIKLEDLRGDKVFFTEMENRVDAALYFDSVGEFRAILDKILYEMIKRSEVSERTQIVKPPSA